MITGEIEYLNGKREEQDYEYDYFFKKLFGKKTAAEKEARKKKRRAFWASIGQSYQDIGGAAGIVGTVGTVKDFIKPSDEPSDFKVGMGHSKEEEEAKKTAKEDKGIPTEVIIIGGIAVLAIGAWGYSRYRKNQAIKKLSVNSK